MSATLKWRPACNGKALPTELRMVLEKNPAGASARNFGAGSIGYLEGLRDAGVEGAQELLDAIHTHGDVNVFWDY